MRRSRRRPAAPFVLTFAALLPGCGAGNQDVRPNPPPPDIHPNPPAPDPTPPPATSTPTASGGNVTTGADGKCWQQADVHCPPNGTCNPPPPKQVPCP